MKTEMIQTQRFVHLSGGLRANLSRPDFLDVFPTGKAMRMLLPLPKPYDCLEVVHSLDLVMLGTEERFVMGQMLNRIWHPCRYRDSYSPNGLPSPELWGTLANAAREQSDTDSASVMENISFTLMAAGLRLRDVSDVYGLQLNSALERGIEKDTKFSNLQVFDLFLNCHAFLAEACSARDYIARFIAKHVYGGIKADSIATLLKQRSKLPPHPVTAILDGANEKKLPDAWMARMSEYRNIITHRAPLAHIKGRNTNIELRFVQVGSERTVPRIIALIPADPFSAENSASIDVLTLLHHFLAQLLHFAAECAKYSPYPPTFPLFDEGNIASLLPRR
jgi:hypothetical protein